MDLMNSIRIDLLLLIKTTVVLADFQLFNKPVKVGSDNSPLSTSITYADHLVLEHKHSIFSLSVATLNYANPSKNQYKYKLEGFEKIGLKQIQLLV